MKTQRSADIVAGWFITDKTMREPEVKKKMDQNGFKTEFRGSEESRALVKKKMVEYEAILKDLGRMKK